jgi:hypothetical protein
MVDSHIQTSGTARSASKATGALGGLVSEIDGGGGEDEQKVYTYPIYSILYIPYILLHIYMSIPYIPLMMCILE